ncbi:MAG: aspartate--tRNA(Asn) ligase [Acidimicrobiales bacterium]
MERTLVGELGSRSGRTVRLCGWADAIGKDDDGAPVLALRDHTGLVDVVGGDGALAADIGAVATESAVEVIGTVAERRDGPAYVVVHQLRVVGAAQGPLPLESDAPLEQRLDWRYLDLRLPRNRLIFEVQTTAERAMRSWWSERGFLEIHSPKLRAMPNQSGRELFTVQYFDGTAYLAQSPQFYKQMAMAAGLERVFEIGPVFRANPLVTTRHDTEFTSVDVEVAWIESDQDLMAMEEQWLQHVVAAVADAHGDEVERRFGRRIGVPSTPFPRVTMAEALERLASLGHVPDRPPGDLDAEGERRLGAQVAAEHGHELVFVTEYPEAVRPFYHMRLEEGSSLTRGFDLLWNGLEVTTGAQREHRYERLVAQAQRNPARVEVIRTYLDFFRHGCPPHGGFGLGLTRMLACLLGLDDVRETTYLHRGPRRLTP